MPARSLRPQPTANASSAAATTARSSPPTPKGETATLATDPKHRWIDHVAQRARRRSPGPPARRPLCRPNRFANFEAPSTVGGLAFLPKGFRLAVAHYNGATLWFPNAPQATPEKLEWKGSHLGVTVSPDGRFLVTTMQEPMLHGWRIADGKHMRMSGYSARVTSFGWTVGGHWLATSGATQLILWPFQSKDGPMGKEPRVLAPSQLRVETVACHPQQEIVAAGYADGMVLLVRIQDGAEILAKKPGAGPGHRTRLERGRPLPRLWHGRRRGRRARPQVIATASGDADVSETFRRPVTWNSKTATIFAPSSSSSPATAASSIASAAPSPARRNSPTPTRPGFSRTRCAAGRVEHDAAWQQISPP